MLESTPAAYRAVDPNDDTRQLVSINAIKDDALDKLNKCIEETGVRIIRYHGDLVLSVPEEEVTYTVKPSRTINGNLRVIDPDHLNEFTDTGLVLVVNQILQIFGFCLMYTENKNGVTSGLTICRTRFRGFSPESTQKAYSKLSDYMVKNANTLKFEADI